jgi:alpha-ketoglutaric semialdehyde dehydrogenase
MHAPSPQPATAAEPILVAGTWRPARSAGEFHAVEPATGALLEEVWPVSGWADVDEALDAAVAAAADLGRLSDAARADFLERYAARLEARGPDLVATAARETGLATSPRLADVELPRMLDQLRQAAAAAREGSWRMAMIDTVRNIRSQAIGLGPVVVFPPGNFPLAYGAVTGGDFAAAIAAGNPVIAKAHPGCPGVSRLAAAEAAAALGEAGLPAATVQLLHGLAPEDGLRLVADPRVGATGFTGSEAAGRRLFAAATAAGRVIWVEMGSLNPVVFLPGAVAERAEALAAELAASVTGSAGQFCTKPGLVFFVADAAAEFARGSSPTAAEFACGSSPTAAEFTRGSSPTAAGRLVAAVVERFAGIGPQVLLGPGGRDRLAASVASLRAAGCRLLAGGGPPPAGRCLHEPTLLEVPGSQFLAAGDAVLVEAFGNATVLVPCRDLDELASCLARVPGSLGASLYAATDGRDDTLVPRFAAALVSRAGRVIENRMPTGLAVTAPMQHGGPWPSAAPPFFSAVGFPLTILRFARRVCHDGWSQQRLPAILRDPPPPGDPWRFIDGAWRRAGG